MKEQAATQSGAPASFAEIFETCIGCGICRDYCPVFEDVFSLHAERIEGTAPHDVITQQADSIAQGCYFCGRCETSCPIDLPLEQMAWQARRERLEREGEPRTLLWSSDADRLLRWRRRLAWLLALGLGLVRKLAQKLTGIDARVPLPGRVPLAKWWRKQPKATPAEGAEYVAVFAGCLASGGESDEAKALIEILERAGCEVELLAHTSCCGAPEFAAGRADAAAQKLELVLGQLERAGKRGDIVVLDTACLKMFRRDSERVGEETARFQKLPLVGAGDLLWRLHRDGKLPRPAHALEGSVAWQSGCTGLALSRESTQLQLLRQIPGLEVKRLDSTCSGFGGAWGLRAENYARASDFCEAHTLKALDESGAKMLAAECASCRLQLAHMRDGVRVVSPIALYREALDPAE